MTAKRISQYEELLIPSGQEETVLAYRGKNYRFKLVNYKHLFPLPTPEEIGLGNVNNTADIDKPVSIPVAEALQEKANKIHFHSKGEIEDLIADLAAINSTLSSMTQSVNGLETNLALLTNSVTDLGLSHANLTEQVNTNITDIDGIRNNIDLIESRHNDLSLNVHTLNSDVALLNASVSLIGQQLSDFNVTAQAITTNFAAITATFDSLLATDETHTAAIQSLMNDPHSVVLGAEPQW